MSKRRSQQHPEEKSPWKEWTSGGRSSAGAAQSGPPPLATPRWILGAILASLCLAALCLYGAICLLFWQGQWQLVFGHAKPVSRTPASIGISYQEIRFDTTQTGVARLDGWWIPAGTGTKFQGDTLLLLRDGSGSLSDSLGQVAALHQLGIGVFAFDYRGFGSSAKIHPSEKSTQEDADAAWSYLTGLRHLAPQTIVLYGTGLGASVAAEAAARHSNSPAVILEDPAPPVLDRLQQHPDAKFLPVRLLFHDRFNPTRTLSRLATPKLFLETGGATATYFDAADPPKERVVLQQKKDAAYGEPAYAAALGRFLSEYLKPVAGPGRR